jgi:hypothetical protein
MFRILFLSSFFLFLTACQSITPQRAREAKLMPNDVAMKVVDKYAAPGFSKSPALFPAMASAPLCTDKSAKPVQFTEMSLAFTANEVSVFTFSGAGFWCGSRLMGRMKVPNEEARDDLVDALISLGVKPVMVDK